MEASGASNISVDHPSGHHDDHANALALAAMFALRTRPRPDRDEEDLRPDGSDVRDELERADELTKLKQLAIGRGLNRVKLAALEAHVRSKCTSTTPRSCLSLTSDRGILTSWMSMRRFPRLTNTFSKQVDTHKAMIALHHRHDNFGRIDKPVRRTPAMEVGASDHVWSLEEIVQRGDYRDGESYGALGGGNR